MAIINNDKTQWGEDFELDIVDFVEKMGFEDVDHNINLGPHEVDVVAGWESTTFLN